jgi:hypothetical protein
MNGSGMFLEYEVEMAKLQRKQRWLNRALMVCGVLFVLPWVVRGLAAIAPGPEGQAALIAIAPKVTLMAALFMVGGWALDRWQKRKSRR